MHEKVKEYLDQKQKEAQREREQELIALGLFEREYRPEGESNAVYPEYDSETQKYYRKVPVLVTDEEYEQIRMFSRKSGVNRNKVATALSVLAILTGVSGVIGGLIRGTLLLSGLSAAISGTILLGYAEIIKLLGNLNNR